MIVNEEQKDFFNKVLTEAFSQGYNKGYNKGYEDGITELLNEKANEDVPDTESARVQIMHLKDLINALDGRVKRLERSFYGD